MKRERRSGAHPHPGGRKGGTRGAVHPRLKVGATVEVDLTDMALDGDPLGRIEEYVVFVPFAIPGERVLARVVSVTRKFARASIVRILKRSPDRVEPPCRHFGPCGGCAWQHIAYPEQLRLKGEMLRSLLANALGKAAPAVLPALGIGLEAGAPSTGARDPAAPWAFRNKAHFVLAPGQGGKGITMGHYRRSSREIVEVEECPVHAEKGNSIAFRLKGLLARHGVPGWEEETGRGVARHIIVRAGEATGDTQATLVAAREFKALPVIAAELGRGDAPGSFQLNIHDRPGPFLLGRETRKLKGRARMREEVAGATFLISPRSFFQTSVRSAERLLGAVLRHVPAGDRRPVLDLYAGVGLFALPLARRGHRVIAVEENPAAVADGIASRAENGIPESGCRFLRSRAAGALREIEDRLERHGSAPGTVILDPPREGCEPGVWQRLLSRWRTSRIIYVSCNPRALADDLRTAVQAGWRIEEAQPVDMFPHTPHIETVCLLTRPP